MPSDPRPATVGDHATMACGSLPELVTKLVPSLAEGLTSGDLVMYICDDHDVEAVKSAPAQADVALLGGLTSN